MTKIQYYIYDGAYRCVACTQNRFVINPHSDVRADENGIPFLARDNTGSIVAAVFDDDAVSPAEYCATCFEEALNDCGDVCE